MASIENYFKNKEVLLSFFKKNRLEAYGNYLAVINDIKKSGFPGVKKLLSREKTDKTSDFLAFLTEFNLANLFLGKKSQGLNYESKRFNKIDFVLDDILIEVKNINAKDYEKDEYKNICDLESSGGGEIVLTHKAFSETFIKVEKTPLNTYSWERIETGNRGFLNSDLSQMSLMLKYAGEFESKGSFNGLKKVLFFMNYSEDFHYYHIDDMAYWYFGYKPKNYSFIFQTQPSWYYKMFKKEKKENNIDAIVFMACPENILIWPNGCFNDKIQKRTRLAIYAKDEQINEKLKKIFV